MVHSQNEDADQSPENVCEYKYVLVFTVEIYASGEKFDRRNKLIFLEKKNMYQTLKKKKKSLANK